MSQPARRRILVLVAALLGLVVALWMVPESTGNPFEEVAHPPTKGGALRNPLSGEYLWFPDDRPAGVSNAAVARDSYIRYTWRELEPSPGVFAFDQIDSELAAAEQRGGRFAFRVMAVCTTCGVDSLPVDVSASPRSWSAQWGTGRTRLPDWNDADFLNRWRALITALGTRYDGDPRLAYVDVGIYGNWGEGHDWPFQGAYPGPAGQRPAESNSLRLMIQFVTSAFPTTFTVINPPQVMAGDRVDHEESSAILQEALSHAPTMGLRNDCLGGMALQAPAARLLATAQVRAERMGVKLEDQPLQRWRIAPFVTEWCDDIRPYGDEGSFQRGLQQVRSWHVTQVSNGNFHGAVEDYEPAEQRAFYEAVRIAGSHITAAEVELQRAKGGPVVAVVQWSNAGTAPPYDRWALSYRLINVDTGAEFKEESEFDLRDVIDNRGYEEKVAFHGTESISGSLRLDVYAYDAADYLDDLEFDIAARSPGRGYVLAEVTIE